MAQGLTLDKVTIDIGKKEVSTGLTSVALSRVKHITDLLLNPPFPFQQLKNLGKKVTDYKRDRTKRSDSRY